MHVPEREEKPVWKGSLWAFSISMTFWKGATVETVGRAVVVRGWWRGGGTGWRSGFWGEWTWFEAVMVDSLCSGL